MDTLRFALATPVTITASGENGEVIGRAAFISSEPSYLVRYKAADGRAIEAWWGESALHITGS